MKATMRTLAIGALAAGGLLASAAPAAAIRISEVYVGHGAGTTASSEFVELQMDGPSENVVQNLHVRGYNGAGGLITDWILPSNVANAETQRTILIATEDAETEFGQSSDEGDGPSVLLTNAGGAVCVENIDCVSWGSFPQATMLPSPAGPPEAVIPDGSSISRSISAGCPTLLELSDDTDNSLNDFSATAPTPRNNAAPPAGTICVPPAAAAPAATSSSGPVVTKKKKCKKKRNAATAKKKCKKKK